MAHSAHRVAVLRTWAAIAAVAGLAGGCSVLFHADATQCHTDGDCRARGGVFVSANYVQCRAGTCYQPEDAGAGESEAGAEAGGPPCNTFSDCPTPTGNHSEVTCNPDSHTCVQLTTDQCPVVLGDYQYSKNVAPVVIGAFSILPSTGGDLTSNPCTRNYLLAIDEFTSGGSGIPAGPGGKLRMPVVVVCNITSSAVDLSMHHLTGDLNVPAVISALDSADLRVLFSNYGYGTSANVFVVNTFGADSTLTSLPRGQQFWHMLGLPGDTAPAYEPLLSRVEGYVRNNGPWNLGSGGTLKVSTVTANATVLNDLALAVSPTLSWNNGHDQAISGDTAFDAETIPDSVLNGATMPNISSAAAGILAFQPHVVVSFASDEFVTLLQTVELQWPSSVPRPVWILSSYNFEYQPLLSWINFDSTKLDRVVGVNFASTTETQVLSQYDSDFLAANPGLPTDYNNCYDATYFAVDSLVAASPLTTRPFTGDLLGQGMLRLIAPAATPYDMGPTGVNGVSSALSGTSSASIKLVGTLGDPQFNTNTGARVGQGDVYCIQLNPPADGGTLTMTYEPDALRLVVPADGGTSTLSGTPCFSGL
jgi:hypothetical protein